MKTQSKVKSFVTILLSDASSVPKMFIPLTDNSIVLLYTFGDLDIEGDSNDTPSLVLRTDFSCQTIASDIRHVLSIPLKERQET